MPITKIGRVAFIVVVVAVAAVLCGWTALHGSQLRPYHWGTVQSPDGMFSVAFPGQPVASTQNDTDAIDGSQFVSNRLALSPAPQIDYMLSWWENPAQRNKSTGELFTHLRDCNEKVFRGKVAAKELTVQGHQALDMISVNSDGTVVHNRVIRAGQRIYSLWVINTSGKFVADDKNVMKFFGSFTLH